MATRTISTKLAVEGEAQYKQAIAACNSELSTLKSGLSLVESEFRNNANSMEALTAKGSALDSMYSKQKEKVATLEDALKNCQRAQEEYSSRVATAKENIERCEKALDGLKDSTEDTSEEQAALTAELDKWNAELSEAQAGQEAAERGVQSWQKQLNTAKVDLNGLSDEIDKNNGYLEEAKESADGCADSIDEFGNETNEAKGTIDALASALAAAGIAKAVEEIAAALKACVDAYSEFEAQMSTVQAISGATGEEMAALSEKAKEMGSTTSFTATQAGQAFEYMAMAGWKTEDMLSGIEGIMNLAAASGESLASTSDIVTDALTGFGLAAKDSAHFADVLAAASSNSNTNVGLMGETFKYAAPVAGALGYSVEDTAVAIGLMANAGIKGSQAGTSLRGTLTNLAKPSKTVAEYMEDLGISLTDNAGNTRSLSELMEILRDRFSNLTEAQKAEYAAGIAGKEAMSGLLAIVNASEKDFNSLTDSINNCNGAAEEMAATKLDNLQGKMILMESAADGLKIAIGEQLAPALGKLAEAGTDALTWATDFVEENPWIVAAVTGLTAALAALTMGVAALSVGETVIKGLSAAIGLLTANPIVAVAAAAAGLAIAIGTWVAAMDDADESTQEFIKGLEETKAAYEELDDAVKEDQAATKATEEALKELLAVEEKSANQKDAIAKMVDELNEKVPGLGLAYDSTKDSINMTTEALDALLERSAAHETYENQVARLSELYKEQTEIEARLEEAQNALNTAQETGGGNVRTLQNNVNELTKAMQENQDQIKKLEDESREYGEWLQKSQEATDAMKNKVDGLIGEMEALEEEYTNAHDKARESIEGQLGLFKKLDGTSKTTIGDLIETLQGQVDFMETYASNIKKAMELGVDEGLIKKLSDGSEESAQILAAIVEGGTEEIKALNEQLARVEEGKESFSDTVAEMETDFDERMRNIEKRMQKAIDELDMSIEAGDAGAYTIQGYIDGAESMRGQLVATYRSLARAANNAYQSELDINSPSRVFEGHGKNSMRGAIIGAEEEKADLEAAYTALAESASRAYERALPSSIEEPSAAEAVNRQTAAIVAAVSGHESGGTVNQFHIDKMEVRDDRDIERIARALYAMQQRENRSRGGGAL